VVLLESISSMENPEREEQKTGLKITRKEGLLLLAGTALALGSFKSDDPWVVIPMLSVSGVVFVYLCLGQHWNWVRRILAAVLTVGVLGFIGWRDLRHPPAAPAPKVAELPGAPSGGWLTWYGSKGRSDVSVTVNSASLISYQDRFRLMTISRVKDDSIDVVNDTRIVKSALFVPASSSTEIETPLPNNFLIQVVKPTKPGTYMVPIDVMLILLPVNVNAESIKTVGNALRSNGVMLANNGFTLFVIAKAKTAKAKVPAPTAKVSADPCPPGTGICVPGGRNTFTDVTTWGGQRGIISSGESNRFSNTLTMAQTPQQAAQTTADTDQFVALVRAFNVRKWSRVSPEQRALNMKAEERIEDEVKSANGDPQQITPLLQELLTLRDAP
jgi:hypothetical protein